MAILTRNGMDKILKRIWDTGGLSADMETDLERLRGDFDEREGVLKKYGEVYEGEDKEEYEFNDRDRDRSTDIVNEEDSKWKEQYDTMRQRYIDRFFGGRERDGETEQFSEEFDDLMGETKDDVKRDGEKQTFDELLERVEG